MKKVLITGVAGMIGSHLLDCLIERRYEIIGMDNLSSVRFDEKILRKLLGETGYSFKKLWERRYDLLLDTTILLRAFLQFQFLIY